MGPRRIGQCLTPEWIGARVQCLQQTGAGTQQLRAAESEQTSGGRCHLLWRLAPRGPASLCPLWSQLSHLHSSLSWPALGALSCEDSSSVASQSAEREVSRSQSQSRSHSSRQQNVQTHRTGWGLRVYTGTQWYIAQEESFNRLRKQTFLCSVIYTERDKRVKTIPRLQPNCPAEVTMSESVIVIIWSNQNIVKRVRQTLNQENSKSRTVVTKFDPCVDKNVQSSLWQAWTARRSFGVPPGSSVFSNYLLHLSDLP